MSALPALRIGTRASQLALWQARHVESLVRAQAGAPAVELVHIKTEGDLQTDVPLWQVQGKAFFTKEIDRALLAGDRGYRGPQSQGPVDPDRAGRHARRDAAARGSARRAAECQRRRRSRRCLRVRAWAPAACGAAPSWPAPVRMWRWSSCAATCRRASSACKQGDYDAIILAAAGLKRLGLQQQITEYLDVGTWPPAVSQGVIGVCARADDEATLRWLTPLDDRAARLAVSAERALLRTLEGGCQVPLGALATLHEEQLSLRVRVCALDGTRGMNGAAASAAGAQRQCTLEDAMALGERVARELLSRGAGELVAQRARRPRGR